MFLKVFETFPPLQKENNLIFVHHRLLQLVFFFTFLGGTTYIPAKLHLVLDQRFKHKLLVVCGGGY